MKTLILKIDDSNMAGFDWTWSFFINKTAKGSFTVSRTQLLDGRTVRFPGSSGLKSGNEVLGAVYYMLDEFSYRLGDYDLDKIAQKIGSVDADLAVDFLAARGEWVLHTTEEENDFYERTGGGPVQMIRAAPATSISPAQREPTPPTKTTKRVAPRKSGTRER